MSDDPNWDWLTKPWQSATKQKRLLLIGVVVMVFMGLVPPWATELEEIHL